VEAAAGERVERIPLDLIDPNPYQPRRVFQPERLQELAQSIRTDGVIQPIMVQPNGSRYALIVGERRWRAAKLAGLTEISAVVRQIPPDRLLEVTLVENIQREDLNPIETAQAFERLVRELNISHEEIARRTGKDRSTITNFVRLLKLPPDIQQLVAERRISMGHARAILGLPDEEHQRAVAEKTAAQGLSVRQVERMVRRMTERREVAEAKDAESLDPNVAAAIRAMEQALGTRVRLVERSNHRGRIEIEYYSDDDLNRIYSIIVHGEAG
jgi:ParB family chromosome partitioning protein